MTGTRTLTQRHRAQQLLLRRATAEQVRKAWPLLLWNDLDGTYPALAVRLAAVVQTNRQTSAALASAYMRSFRIASGIPGSVKPILPEPLIVEQFATSLRVTSVVAVKQSTVAGVAPEIALSNALTQTSGSMSRLVLNAGRSTVVETTLSDDRAAGWQRVLGGSTGCSFCQMLVDRGAVYSESTSGFESHDHCGCSAEPVYR